MKSHCSRQISQSPVLMVRGLVLMALILTPATLLAATFDEFSISVAPNPGSTDEPMVVTVTGVASCPTLSGPGTDVLGNLSYGFSDICPTLPPAPSEFTLHALLGPLPAGIFEVRLVDPNSPPIIIASTTVTVNDPQFSVQLMPSPATESDDVIAHVEGFGSDPYVDTPEIEPGLIRLRVRPCGICDPPPIPGPFQQDVSLGQLAAGEYEVELLFVDQPVGGSMLEVLPAESSCVAGNTALCLKDGRFRVEVAWTTSEGLVGPGMAVEETGDTGLFWFFDSANIELIVKVLDACDTEFESFWVFAGGLTDVGAVITVTDTETGEIVVYENPVGQRFETITDTAAFAGCPVGDGNR